MVNPGHASRGCSSCKMRRIKCDETRPGCTNCARSKRICLGYGSHGPSVSQTQSMSRNGADVALCQSKHVGLLSMNSSFMTRYFQSIRPSIPKPQARVENITQRITEFMEMNFRILAAPSCSLKDRKLLMQRYQDTTRDLAGMLSSATCNDDSQALSFLSLIHI